MTEKQTNYFFFLRKSSFSLCVILTISSDEYSEQFPVVLHGDVGIRTQNLHQVVHLVIDKIRNLEEEKSEHTCK